MHCPALHPPSDQPPIDSSELAIFESEPSRQLRHCIHPQTTPFVLSLLQIGASSVWAPALLRMRCKFHLSSPDVALAI
jgi:hypothetical protein